MTITLPIETWREISKRRKLYAFGRINGFTVARYLSESTGFDCVIVGAIRNWTFRDGINITRKS